MASRSRDPEQAGGGRGHSMEAIYQRIYDAILEHRLRPGTKLTEERVADLFSVSRTQVRSVLQRLAVEQLVRLVPNRGAFVTTPTVQEVLDVLQVRRTLEPEAVRVLIDRVGRAGLSRVLQPLRLLVGSEREAERAGDRRTAIRLSGDFHIRIAELSGSAIMTRIMRGLAPLTSLAILAYEATPGVACPLHDHEALLDAIASGDGARAGALMRDHIDHIRGSLNLDVDEHPDLDLAEALLG